MKLGIYGAGGLGREICETAMVLGSWDEIVFIDDFNQEEIHGIRRMSYNDFRSGISEKDAEIVIALGEPTHKKGLREKVEKDGYSLATVIHPSANISRFSRLGKGMIVRAQAVVSVDTFIGDNVTIMEHTYIGHDVTIGCDSQVSANVSIGGNVSIGSSTFIGAGVSIKERINIGSDVVVGMGAIVLDDISDDIIYHNAIGKSYRTGLNRRVFE